MLTLQIPKVPNGLVIWQKVSFPLQPWSYHTRQDTGVISAFAFSLGGLHNVESHYITFVDMDLHRLKG